MPYLWYKIHLFSSHHDYGAYSLSFQIFYLLSHPSPVQCQYLGLAALPPSCGDIRLWCSLTLHKTHSIVENKYNSEYNSYCSFCLNFWKGSLFQSGHKGLFKYRVSRFSTPPDGPLSPVSESELLTYPPSPHFDLMVLEQRICVCPSYSNWQVWFITTPFH